MNNDLISRSALKKDLLERSFFPVIMKNALENAPAVDAVEVVQCKDCKYRDPENHHCDHVAGTMIYFPRKPDDFCSYGERRN